jgi:DNA-binding transcriptional ArsR family regulator
MKDLLQPKRCARLLAALAAPERLRVVGILRERPRSVSELAELLKQRPVNVSHHLTVLRRAKLVRTERRGRFIMYSLAPGVFQPKKDSVGQDHLDLGCCRIEIPKRSN